MFRVTTHHPFLCGLAGRSCQAPATVAVDFDGVLHQKSGRFSDQVTGEPVHGAADGLRRLAECYHVVIFTARTALDPVRRWLEEHRMDGFEVTREKPPAEFYIDDHGFHFTSWADVERKLLNTSAEPSAKVVRVSAGQDRVRDALVGVNA